MNIKDVRTRKYIYGVAVASVPILLLLKVITPESVDVIINWLSAVLALGAPSLALANTPATPPAND
jgi:hypothetical protein